MNPAVTAILLGLAIVIFIYGFERYRRRFAKIELLTAIVFSVGLGVLAVGDVIVGTLMDFLSIEKNYVLASMIANTLFIFISLYLLRKIRETRTVIHDLTRELSLERSAPDNGEDNSRVIEVVIPAYNEEATIRSVVEALPDTIQGYEVVPVIVSDGSGDQTAEKAAVDGAIVVEHPINQGQGGALKTGFEFATGEDRQPEIIVTMDADGQHAPEDLDRLVRPIIGDEADFVIGSRYRGANRSDNWLRGIGIRTFSWLISFLTKTPITDCTNGYRAIRTAELERLTLTEDRFSAPELIIEARKKGLRIQEVPVTVYARREGASKKPQIGYALGLARAVVATWLR